MTRTIPIRDLAKTSKISEMCRASDEPIFVTKNGYGEMVIMSIEAYERTMYINITLIGFLFLVKVASDKRFHRISRTAGLRDTISILETNSTVFRCHD